MAERKGIKEMFFEGDWAKLRWWEFGPFVFFYVIWFAVRGLIRNRGTVLTGSLAFTTALSVVPLISVAFWGLLTFGNFDNGAVLEPYIQQLFPASANGIVDYLAEFARTSASEVAGIGALVFYGIGFFLFLAIEKAFNIIWMSHRKRPIVQKLGAFLLIMSFGPLLLSFSFGLTGYAAIQVEQFNVDPGIVLVLVPFALAFLAFTAMNHFLPTTKVHAWASILAGAFTAAAFELGKHGFNYYVTELVLVPYNQIYGTLGLFPLFLVWLYVIWIVVLFGAELAYTAQNLRTVVRVEHASRRNVGVAGEHVFNPTIGLELYAPIARAFKSGEGRFTDRDLVALTGYPESVVRAVVAELSRIGALEVVDEDEGERRLIPAKQLDDIELQPMLEAFIDFNAGTDARPVADLLRRYQAATNEALSGVNALAFVPGNDQRARTPRPEPARPEPARQPAPRPEPAPAPVEPLIDADIFDAPPQAIASSEVSGPTLDAKPLARARAIADRAKNLRSRATPDRPESSVDAMESLEVALEAVEAVEEPPPAMETEDPIRINTQDILVEEDDLELIEEPDLDTNPSAIVGESTRKNESSIEIDIAGMWDDFEVDNYDDILAKASREIDRASLGGLEEKSSPPPMPKPPRKK